MADNRGMPSMLALLGLVAVAGYQNRDKIAQVLQGRQGTAAPPDGSAGPADGQPPAASGGLLSELGNLFGGAAPSATSPGTTGTGTGTVSGGLNDLLNTFRNAGQHDVANSWVTPGVPTQGLSLDQVESAIGKDALTELSQRTGLGYDEIVQRLSTAIPDTVDRLTPNGQFPQSEDEARQLLTKP